MGAMKTPGVYIVEKNAFPNSVVEVSTAVPAFIGYTEKAVDKNKSLIGKPKKISSLAEFQYYFGGSALSSLKFSVKKQISEAKPKTDETAVTVAENKTPMSTVTDENGIIYEINPANDKQRYTLFFQMQLFYANGGGACYIVSVGNYNDNITEKALTEGIIPLLKEQEPTMVLIPEAVQLPSVNSCGNVQQAMLQHCGNELLRNRIAVLDVFDGYKGKETVDAFRENVGSNFLDYGAAYYPWLNTSVIPENAVTFQNTIIDELKTALEYVKEEEKTDEEIGKMTDEEKKSYEEKKNSPQSIVNRYIGEIKDGLKDPERTSLHNTLTVVNSLYNSIMKEIRVILNLLPPAPAMAGIYTLVDNTRGVWKAPANVSVAGAISPAVNISHQEQEDLNVPLNGKSVNAIRYFVGDGIKVWGARTLNGNSLDWRYINVRRTMIFLEESIKNAARAYVFDPNDANTWVNIKSMIRNFLNGVWKRGGLAGASPDDAYAVYVGLGETMTPEDILEGVMKITVLVAITRPAEFIEITFQQQMQKS